MRYIRKIIYFILLVFSIDYVTSTFLLTGINKFYGLNQHSEMLLVGHSHLMLATDKEDLEKRTNLSVSKYTREGVNVADRYVMIKQFLSSSYSDSLQTVIYGVDAYTFTTSGLSENSYTLFYPFMEDEVMNNYIKDSVKDKYDYWIHKIFRTSRYSELLLNAAGRGWLSNWSNLKFGEVNIKKVQKEVADKSQRKIVINPQAVATFKETLELVTKRGIKVILLNTPLVDILNNAEPEQYKEVIGIFESMAVSNPFIEYWDYNHPPYSTDYSLFFDPIHLNPKGQQAITEKVAEQLNNKRLKQ